MTDALPDNVGYVAAAYLVFFALLLIYVAIMAGRLSRLERDLSDLNKQLDSRETPTPDPDPEKIAS